MALVASVTVIVAGAGVAPAEAVPNRAYVTLFASAAVAVVDTATDSLVTTVAVDEAPVDDVLSPDGSRLYVSDEQSGAADVSVINTATNTTIAHVSLAGTANTFPVDLAVSPDGTRLYVSSLSTPGALSVIDTVTDAVVATVIVGDVAGGVAVSPDGTRVYVASQSGTVSVVDAATDTVIDTISLGNSPIDVALSPDGSRAYVTEADGPQLLSVLDLATDTVVATVGTGDEALGVVLSPDGTRAYVSSRRGTVTVIDTATNTVVATVAAGDSPGAEAMSSDGSRLFVSTNGNVLVIDTATNAVVASLMVGDDPGGIAVTSASARNFLVTVSGSQGYGSSSPTFSTTTSAPAGDSLNGTVTCVTVDRPARLISPILPPGLHTINGTSCSGLTLSGPTASDFEVNYRGGPFTVGPVPPGVCLASPSGGSGSGSGTVPCETSTTVSVVAGATAAPGVPGLPVTGQAEGIPLAGGAGLIVVVLGLRGLRRRTVNR